MMGVLHLMFWKIIKVIMKKYSEQNDFDRLKSDYEILKLTNANKYLLLKKFLI